MDTNSRTYKSLRNSIVALSIFAINLILQFFSRKIFIDYLGTEVLGLNTTATSLLQFLNLAELGVGAAITYALYRPLETKDYNAVNEIVSVQGWLYRKIATVVIAGSVILMFFFPLIFDKMELPLWYAYASFGVLLFSSLLSYFVNYKQIVLTASQQEYKIQSSYRVALLVKILFQIFFIKYMDNGYVWWLVLEFIFAIIASLVLNVAIKRSCPYLHTDIKSGSQLRKKYPEIVTKIKQFFFHKISIFVLKETSTIIIYAYTTLTMVAIYGNYMLIVNGLLGLLNAVFNGMAASVGSLVAEGDQNKILKVFRELFSSRFWIVTILAFGIYMLADPFISLWVGPQYQIDKLSLFLIVFTFYLNTIRSVVDSFINAYGLFKDIWAPIVEACINLGCSVLFGSIWGLPGILAGVIVSLMIIVFTWKPYFLFKEAIRAKVSIYVKMYVKHIIIFIVAAALVIFLSKILPIDPSLNIISFISFGFITVTLFAVLLFVLLFTFEEGMKGFSKRFIKKIK